MKKPMSGKKLLSLCLALVLVLALLPGEVLAVDGGGGHCGDGLSWNLKNGILTISGSGAMYTYSAETAPWYRQLTMIKGIVFAGNDVTSIGDYAFYGCTYLTYVDLPANLTRIGVRAFSGCTALNQITIRGSNSSGLQLPTTISSIGSYAFENCSRLTNGFSIPSRVTAISEGMLSGCEGLTTVGLPSGAISIGNNAFQGCRNLESIEIPSGVTSIGSGAFQNCARLDPINGLTIPSGVTVLNDYTFDGCSALKKLTLPAGLTAIGNYALCGCSSLPELTIPNGVKTIGNNAFEGCAGLEELSLPAGVTQIGTWAFANCTGLKTVTIPEGVTEIPAYAFSGDSALEMINLPASLTKVGVSAFNGCILLKKVIYAGNREDWSKIQIEAGNTALTSKTPYAADDSTIPVMVSATAAPGKITVTWEGVVNEIGYTVMRRQKKSRGWTDWQNLPKTD
ncbi:MAG: leucine-rich repeat domain-containing protein, partial [Oscillospiraceae bacterium]|nr:leucine-rich repeat domain-containing protein [Oscillospiraceae bacterium]